MKHTFPKHDLLNITTGRLYTPMENIYNFFDKVIGGSFTTAALPAARSAILPILQRKLPNLPFDKTYDTSIPNDPVSFEFNEEDQKEFKKDFKIDYL